MDSVHATEEWRPVEGWPYDVSSLGRVRRAAPARGTRVGKVLKGSLDRKGYATVTLRQRRGRHWVARLVCAAFHGPAPSPAHEVRHLDGVKLNNTPSNLKWGTRSENAEDRRRHGTMPMGENHVRHRLSDAEVRAIRAEHAEVRRGRRCAPHGWQKSISERYGIPVGSVWSLTSGTNRGSLRT